MRALSGEERLPQRPLDGALVDAARVTSAQRFFSALIEARGRWAPAERPPVFFTGGAWVGRVSGLSQERLLNDAVALADAQRSVHGLVGQDALLAYYDPLFIPEAYGCELRFLDAGPVVKPLPFSRIQAWPPRLDEGRIPVVLDAIAGLAAYGGGTVPVGTLIEGPLTTLSRIVGAEAVLRLVIRDPEGLAVALERVEEMLAAFVGAAVGAGADFLVAADPVASATMISPGMYRRFALPPQRRLFHAAGVPVILHICGDTAPILAAMAESGAAALSLDQCMDLRRARTQMGEACALAGNVDPLTLLMGPPDQVVRETKAVVAAGGSRHFLVMPGCGIPPNAPLENVIAMVSAVRSA